MSKSRKKKAITKVNGSLKDSYQKTIRRNNKQSLKTQLSKTPIEDIDDELILENPKAIINDYDYIDYVDNCENDKNCHCLKEYGRKKCNDK